MIDIINKTPTKYMLVSPVVAEGKFLLLLLSSGYIVPIFGSSNTVTEISWPSVPIVNGYSV